MRFWGIVLAAALFFGSAAGWAEKLDEQEKLKVIQKELEESKEKLQQTKQQQQSVLGKLVVITQELKKAGKKLKLAEGKILVNEVKIGELAVELRKTEEDLSQKAGMLEKRIREAYKSSGTNYLDLIFNSASMSDFLSRVYFFERVIAQDAGLVQEIAQDLRQTRTRR